jgi:hypothetical protein
MIVVLASSGWLQVCARTNDKAKGRPTTQFIIIFGFIQHKPDIAENERSIGNLFLDFLVKQTYINVWFLTK